ncbi:MAG: TlpA family protein disulfide reductase [Elusimicrobia bacterium]|nr:TlpA family protein disulfide reductase [Elusimicrobiota bacterium]
MRPDANPDFELKGLAGRAKKLSDFRGKVVLRDFWAAYCGPCRDSIPEFQRLHERLLC